MLAISPAVHAQVSDSFSRPDNAAIGNGWIEKTPQAFELVNGAAVKQAVGTGYRDNIVYRPAAENLLDVEASVEMRLTSASPGYPQLFTRVQSATVATNNVLTGYILYIDNSQTRAVMGRQVGSSFLSSLATLTLSPALNTTDRYRLRMSATGTNPVVLNGFVERWNGAGWDVIGQASANDTAGNQIATAGSVGFSGYIESGYNYDEFVATDLSVGGNPAPVLTSVSPAAVTAGGSAFSLTVNGSDFIPGSIVRWNGSDRATTFVSATELQAAVTATDIAVAGSASVTVRTPAPGGGTSSPQTVTIDPIPGSNPVPVAASLTPFSATAGGSAFALTVDGSGFVPESIVRWNGSDRATTFVSDTQLQASISAADIANAGSASVTVFSPAPGGGTSGSQTFTIQSTSSSFFDPFSRADGPGIGNGWIEKSPQAFSLAGGTMAKQAVSSGYRDNVVYRPAAENLLDVEASVELQLTASSPGYPQLLTRIQNTVTGNNVLDAYILYVDDSQTRAVIGRQTGSSFLAALATLNIAPALNTTDRYRLRMSATGTNPVQLVGYVERWNGASWDVIGQAAVNDISGNRIVSQGSVGVSGYIESGYTYDNFTADNLSGGGNPTPVLSVLQPASATAGDSAFSMTVTGSNFIPGSVVRWNGGDRTTTFVSPTELQAAVAAADLAVAGTASITVSTPAPGGGSSSALTFTIDPAPGSNPIPAATAITPLSATEGGSAFALTVDGSGFVADSVVRWNGSDRATTFVSDSQLQATITAADIAVAGNASVAVFSPAPGGGTSNVLAFAITPVGGSNPLPVLNTISPDSAAQGGASFLITVNGSDFATGSTVRWNGQNRTTAFVSANELLATITSADIASAGTAAVTVFSPAPGGGTSAAQTFTITDGGPGSNPAPEVLSLSPNSAVAGDAAFTLSVIGSDFTGQSEISWNGQTRTTTFVSAQQLNVTVSAADVANANVNTIVVTTPAPGGGISNPYPFFTLEAGSAFFLDDFNSSNNPIIGNDWTEKNPSAFSINDDAVSGVQTSLVFRDNIVYRPASEDRSNVEVGVEFVRLDDISYPQVHARAQRSTITAPDRLNSYILYIEDRQLPTSLMAIAISPDTASLGECHIAALPLNSQLIVGERYRLRFRVIGDNPVQLSGELEWFTGGEWQSEFSMTVQHDVNTPPDTSFCAPGFMPPQITTAGSSGFSKWLDTPDDYDNYYWIDLNTAAGTPTITSLSPNLVTQNDPAFDLVVSGSNFVPNSVVRWNGTDRPTTYLTSTALQAAISATDISTSGTVDITVSTPPPGGGISNTQTLDIIPENQQANPVPTLDSFAPASIGTGASPVQVTLTGSNFVSTSSVRWNGADRPTSFVSDTSLIVTIPAADIANPGFAALAVNNPSPGGGTTPAVSIPVLGPTDFFDNFNRASNADPGNGWLEKTPDAFSIVSGALQKNGVSSGYIDNVVYRPVSEARLNVESSAEFLLLSPAPGYPQIFTRLQAGTVASPGSLDGYMFYINNSTSEAILARQRGSSFAATLSTLALSEALNTQETYRLRMTVTGTNPVSVAGFVERLSPSGFVVIGQATVNDSSPQRIQTPGLSGVSGYIESSYAYDNFRDGDF